MAGGDVVVGGASGLIGSALGATLQQRGRQVRRLVRPGAQGGPDTIAWDPAAGTIDAEALEGVGAVVNLAGKAVGPHRWTEAHRTEVLESRTRSTSLLAKTIAALDNPPSVLVNASASGYYGDRGDEILTEDAPPGSGFLAGVCQAWEAATAPASEAGIRVAMLRTGLVLASSGGALGAMLPIFKLGLGGKIGSGTQWWSWIDLEDEVGAILHLIDHDRASGPFNLAAPDPVTNAGFTALLAKALSRPAALTVPKFVLRTALGGFADEALLASQRLSPVKLLDSGYRFLSTDLLGALQVMLAA
ncbi:MAG: uncharacterized protein QOD62_409 [Actinomycetota bacterium]|nr:uncharacterized protein [Actinomycetota bacterium]